MKKYKVLKKSLSFLEELIKIASLSGSEKDIQNAYINYLKPTIKDFDADMLGNVSAILNPDATFKVMLAAHCDQVGLMVQYIDSNGFLMINKVGGPNLSTYSGQNVLVKSNDGKWLPGVIQRKSNSFSKDEIENIENYFIDIGVSSEKEASRLVSAGTQIVVDTKLQKLTGFRYTASAFDDKIGVFAIAEAIKILSKYDLDIGVYAVSTVQEEVGTLGAKTASHAINPNVGIAVDVNYTSDYTSSPKKIVGNVGLGLGAVLVKGINVNAKVDELLTTAAKKENIKTQMSVCPGRTGTDARTIQLAGNGVATGLVKIPLRYMHSPTEVLDMSDVEDTINLLVAFVLSISEDIDFRPVQV
ncbi:MAG: M20/M25/M40 family metallo-hydrolase [Kiritimatiellae bacterium]|nr:M20/M25/M40 family metallo-hydrolase [Kiritimatiellia bacterium]